MPIALPYHIYRFAAKEQFFPFLTMKKDGQSSAISK